MDFEGGGENMEGRDQKWEEKKKKTKKEKNTHDGVDKREKP